MRIKLRVKRPLAEHQKPCRKVRVIVRYNAHGPVYARCGSSYGGERVMCDPCEARYRREFPQGWRHVPGDTCEHGVYTGDAFGPDLMCGRCEGGW